MLPSPLQFAGSWELSLMLALMASTLIVSSELLMYYYGKTDVRLSKKRLHRSAWLVSGLFLATIVFRVATLIVNG
ncbi:MAG: hypothetical protein ACQCN5_07685 [Candidatus Bathyarchaeia archaeon]|jgi:hypothetical protein